MPTRTPSLPFSKCLFAALVFGLFGATDPASACFTGWYSRTILGWNAQGAALVHRSTLTAIAYDVVEIWPAGASEPSGCFDLAQDDFNTRRACTAPTDWYNEVEDEAEVTRLRTERLSALRVRSRFSNPVRQLKPRHFRARLAPHPIDEDGHNAHLIVELRAANGSYSEVLRRGVQSMANVDEDYDEDGNASDPSSFANVQVKVFPNPSGSRALIHFTGDGNPDDMAAMFPTTLSPVRLPTLPASAFIAEVGPVYAVPSAGTRLRSEFDVRRSAARAFNNRAGLAAHRQGNYTASANAFADAITHQPNAAMPRFNLACAYTRLGMQEQALQLLEGLASRANSCTRCGRALRNARTDSDLESLRSDPRFQRAVAAGGEQATAGSPGPVGMRRAAPSAGMR